MAVLHREFCRVRESMTAGETRDRPAVMHPLCGAREGLADQTGNTWPQDVVEALQLRGVVGLLREGLVPCRRHHPCVGNLWTDLERGLFPVDERHLGPPRGCDSDHPRERP